MVNNVKTFVLLAGLLALGMAAGQFLGGAGGLLIGGSFGMVMAFVSYWFSDRMVLRGYGARLVTRDDAPELYDIVDTLRKRAGLPMPRIAITPAQQPNAFATGRSPAHAVVAVTTGALQNLSHDELAAVLAHELGHVKNHDMLVQTVAAGIAAMISQLPYILLFFGGRGDDDGNALAEIGFALLAPFVAMLIQFAISRQREFAADRTGAEIIGKGRPLADALTHLDAIAHQVPMRVAPALAPLAQVDPLPSGGMAGLFRTHPSTPDRVRALLAFDAGH